MAVSLEKLAQRQRANSHRRYRNLAVLHSDNHEGIEMARLNSEHARMQHLRYEALTQAASKADEQSEYWRDCAEFFKIKLKPPHAKDFGNYALVLSLGCSVRVSVDDYPPSLNIGGTDAQGRSLLHYAAFGADPIGCRSLLELGANATLQDCYGNTPLHYLCLNFRTLEDASQPHVQETFQTLLHFNADPECPNLDGLTPRKLCPRAPHFDMVRKREKLLALARRRTRMLSTAVRHAHTQRAM